MARLGGKLRLGVAIAIIAATAACSSIYRNHGYVPAQEVLDEIVVGLDTRDSVAETAGPPSAMGVTDAGGFYYVRSRTRTLGFRAPEVDVFGRGRGTGPPSVSGQVAFFRA